MSNCEDGDVRLVDGSTQYEGRVEVCINKVWGTVCSSRRYSFSTNYYWGTPDSKVVCRQLGYMELGTIVIFLLLFIILYIYIFIITGSVTYTTATQFGQGTSPILMSVVKCSGQESNLLDCPYRPFLYSTCSHSFDVGVKCEGKVYYSLVFTGSL